MYLSSIATATPPAGLSALSQGSINGGIGLVVIMTLVYLWYTVGSARLAQKLEVKRAVSRKSRAVEEENGGVATLVHSDVILHEQPDGEVPIALSRGLIVVGRLASFLGWLSVCTFILGLILRAVIEQHAPWSDLYEFSLSFTAALLLCYLIFEIRFHERVRAWGLYVSILATLTLGIAFYLGVTYNMINPSQELIPALQDQTILTIHVAVAIFAYALFCVAFGAGLIMLIQGDEGQRFRWLPSSDAADALAYKAVIAGFPLLALTLILGAFWANYAWGHYWSWDPKETSALVTWLIYAVYLHARGIRGWRGKRIAWLLTLGFVATLFTYYGVSFFVPSLHSYATPG